MTPDQSGHVVPEHGTHVTSDQFKAGLAEVRVETAGLDSRLSMEIASPACEPRGPSGPAPVKLPAAPGVLVGSCHTGRGVGPAGKPFICIHVSRRSGPLAPASMRPWQKAPLHSSGDASRVDGVAPRSNMPNMLPRRALPRGRLAALGATRGFTTGSYAWCQSCGLRHALHRCFGVPAERLPGPITGDPVPLPVDWHSRRQRRIGRCRTATDVAGPVHR